MEGEEYEEVKGRSHYEVHEGIIFVIELTSTIFVPNPKTGKSALQEIFEALQESMSHSIITLPNTGYGCYIFNSNTTSKGCKPGIECLFQLTDLNYENMKYIQDILEENMESKDESRPYVPLEERFKVFDGERDENPLYEVLVTLQDEFLIKKDFQKQYNNKKVFLFTDNDKPIIEESIQEKNVLRRLFSDLDDAFINIVPFFLSSEHKPFNDQLYSELVLINKDDGEDSIFDDPNTRPIDAASIKDRVQRRKEIKRIQFQCPLIFNDDLTIGLKGYSIYSHERVSKTKFIYENQDSRKNVYSRRRFINEKTGVEFEKTTKLYKFGTSEDYIQLSDEQMNLVNKYDEKYESFMRILGFKDELTGLKFHYNTSKIPFIVPDEDTFEGSTRTLSALFQSLKKLNKVAILFGKLRKGAQPSIFALQPTSKPFPQGFFLIRLPFLDDIRKFPEGYDYHNEPSQEMKLVTRQLLRRLKLKNGYEPKDFKNPSLQLHFKVLHDFLLQIEQEQNQDEEKVKLENDDTLKKINQVRHRIEQSQLNDENEATSLYGLIKRWNSVYNRE
ncbi:hypothetical protein WICANDRAFT_29810 [Wickerhamomyces anomalus NRRL Y-366-8]|uniref:ATP-dependent DNA helicase II subunit 1 n=1 Tax=Wickerhamomyces anomalus (strain ATCC 58044 / CBS 1984 / NCYC 433 / NRRL Y-366-8) TaxID=683960 RepID=A0A1E3P480_WICAA|nr:uncharacterized protein WICANDRAFT_29810 [Wickerhamomyces anomalus NRRL Y-366-8]ODQ60306.1 hypothetical protein WICANDRAFT_29810 [Wickerhamomyces anomalus NRRL Y-366-8]